MAASTIQARRKVIAILLLALAVLGALMRQLAEADSLAHDIGTLLLVMWVPVVGNIVGYFMKKYAPKPRLPAGFTAGAPFTAHVSAGLQFDVEMPDLGAPWTCTLLQGTQGYTVRLRAMDGAGVAVGAGRGIDAGWDGTALTGAAGKADGAAASTRVADGHGASAAATRAVEFPVVVQFLSPTVALPRFAAGAQFRIVSHATVVGHGRVLGPSAAA